MIEEDVTTVLKTVAGRRLLHKILVKTNYFGFTTVKPLEGGIDPMSTSYNNGQRDVGVWLMEVMKSGRKEEFFKFLKEGFEGDLDYEEKTDTLEEDFLEEG